MVTLEDFHSDDPIAWCPGCGNFSILKALKQALVDIQQPPHELVIVSGIGQAPKTPHYLRCNCFNGLHGRTLPVATGIKLANHKLTVIALGGDGNVYMRCLHQLQCHPVTAWQGHGPDHCGIYVRPRPFASLVKDGKTSKEIADVLNVSETTVNFHRKNLRVKFGLRNKRTNLRSYLMSIS